MVSSRHFRQEYKGSGKIPIQESNSNHGGSNQASISGLKYVINALLANENDSYLENFIRRVVREEVEHKVRTLSRLRVTEGEISEVKNLEICFINKLPDKIFTQANIIAEDESPLQIALFDVRSKSIVNEGPLSSIKIEICALNGEFESNGNEIEFNASILRARDGKGPLLVGERFITLENGVGCINKIIFTDNSRWLRSGKFRLGAKVVQPTSNGEKIKEGTSEPFVVKDYRGESYKKHYPPFLKDDIWRLMKIAKEGKFHKRLSQHEIRTVKDLLQLLIINESSLYEKFGKIQKKSWLAIIKHAKSCVIDDYKLYSYYKLGQPVLLLFNVIYKLVGVTFDGQNYCSPDSDTLTPIQKNFVEIAKQDAYKNVDDFELVDEASLNALSLAACLEAAGQSDSTVQGLQYIDTSTAQGMHGCQIYADSLPETSEIPQNSNVEDEMYIEANSYGSRFPVVQSGYSTEVESSDIQFIIGSPPPSTTCDMEPENGFLFGSFEEAEFSTLVDLLNSDTDASSSGKSKTVWCKIRATLKWVISVRRDAVARRNAKLLYFDY